jgi:tRNA modification GTPase
MFSTDDTIAAIATPLGRSGVGIVRLSGPDSARIACTLLQRSRPLQARRATFAKLPASQSSVGDQVIVTYFPGPHSYTGEDVTELSAHGSPVVLQGILRAVTDRGARLAEPGEFTLRAFLNGKLDLVQAEAIGDLIAAVTPLQARAAFDQLDGTLTGAIREIESKLFDLMARLEASLDFPEEGYHFVGAQGARVELDAVRGRIEDLLRGSARGRLLREGASVAIIGTPNVGKSSLFNALLQADRAIVTPIAGTTRDLVTERVDLSGLSIALVDTAGLRTASDVVEIEGVTRARHAAANADVVIVVLDGSRPLDDDDREVMRATAERPRVIAINKADVDRVWAPEAIDAACAIRVSARTGTGLDELAKQLIATLGGEEPWRDVPTVTNVRHITLLEQAREALSRGIASIGSTGNAISEEFLLADVQDASACLQEITGRRTADDLLQHIFQNFCIGK